MRPLEGFQVLLEFSNGVEKIVDLEPLLHGAIFETLREDPEQFRAVRVEEELGTIVWDNGADMDPDVLYGTHVPEWIKVEESVAT